MLVGDPVNGGAKGIVLAAANTFVIALVLVISKGMITSPDEGVSSFDGPLVMTGRCALVFCGFVGLAIIPAMLAGAVVGHVAERLDTNAWVRLVVLAWTAVSIVAVFGMLGNVRSLIVPASLPTLAGVAILEGWTRRSPPIPPARVVDPKRRKARASGLMVAAGVRSA